MSPKYKQVMPKIDGVESATLPETTVMFSLFLLGRQQGQDLNIL